MIEARSLDIGYAGNAIVRGIDFRLESGRVYCLLGPNGCGKTTLFKTVMGLIRPISGEIGIDGLPVGDLSRRDMARNIAYVAQNHGMAFPYLCREIVLMGRSAHLGLFDTPGKADFVHAEAALDSVGMADWAEVEFTSMSGGQQQLVLIARALAQHAGVIVMDEPTANLDFGNQMLVLEKIRRLADDGLGIILSTHNPDHAFRVADETLLMADGKLAAMGAPDEILTAEVLSRVYDFPVAIEILAGGARVCVPSFGAER